MTSTTQIKTLRMLHIKEANVATCSGTVYHVDRKAQAVKRGTSVQQFQSRKRMKRERVKAASRSSANAVSDHRWDEWREIVATKAMPITLFAISLAMLPLLGQIEGKSGRKLARPTYRKKANMSNDFYNVRGVGVHSRRAITAGKAADLERLPSPSVALMATRVRERTIWRGGSWMSYARHLHRREEQTMQHLSAAWRRYIWAGFQTLPFGSLQSAGERNKSTRSTGRAHTLAHHNLEGVNNRSAAPRIDGASSVGLLSHQNASRTSGSIPVRSRGSNHSRDNVQVSRWFKPWS